MSSVTNTYKKEGKVQYMPVDSGASYEIGELATYDTTNHEAEPFDAIADSTEYVGVFGSRKDAADTTISEAKVYKGGVFEFDVASGSYHQDDEFRWSAARRTVALSTSNQIGRCFKATGASAVKVLLKIDAYIAY